MESLLEAALQLPAEARSALTTALIDSLAAADAPHDGLADIWRKELQQRRGALLRGEVAVEPWADVRARRLAL